jgi:Zn-dependent protease with chaperone function
VVLTSGLLERVRSENELAFVLGHELGHFRHRDHLRGLGRELALGVVLAGLGLSGAGPAGDLAGLAARLAERGFDRDQERAADAFGLELLAAEYGHVAGASQFFELVEAPDGGLAAWLSTHPLGDERAASLEALAAARGWRLSGPLQPPPAR